MRLKSLSQRGTLKEQGFVLFFFFSLKQSLQAEHNALDNESGSASEQSPEVGGSCIFCLLCRAVLHTWRLTAVLLSLAASLPGRKMCKGSDRTSLFTLHTHRLLVDTFYVSSLKCEKGESKEIHLEHTFNSKP